MMMTRLKEDISALSYEIIKRSNFIVKFRVKTYYMDANNQDRYYHNEYVYNSGQKRQATISITPKMYLQIDIVTDAGNKKIYFINEPLKNKFIKKSLQLITLLEAYEDHEIDIIKIDASGTHISKNIPSPKMIFGKCSISIKLIIREEKNDIGVLLTFDDETNVIISVYDFLELYYKLKDLSYTNMYMFMINYLGCPELGKHETDFRATGVLDTDYNKVHDTSYPTETVMSELKDIAEPRTTTYNKKINW